MKSQIFRVAKGGMVYWVHAMCAQGEHGALDLLMEFLKAEDMTEYTVRAVAGVLSDDFPLGVFAAGMA